MVSSPFMTQLVHPRIKIDNQEINEVFQFKFLGILTDNRLKFKEHIEAVKSKLSLLSGTIYRLKNHLTLNCLVQVYFALIYPHLMYCSAIWGGANSTLIHSLFVTQKKLFRVMFCKTRYAHTHCIFRDNRLLKVSGIIHVQSTLFVHIFFFFFFLRLPFVF